MWQLPPALLSRDLNRIIMIFCIEVESWFISSFPSSSIPFPSSREKGRKRKQKRKSKGAMYDKPEYIIEHAQEIIPHPVKKPASHRDFSCSPTIMRWYHFQISKCGHHGHGKRHGKRHAGPAPANSPEKNRNSKNRIKNSKRRSQSPGFKRRGYASPSVMKK